MAARGCECADNTTAAVGLASLAVAYFSFGRLQRHVVAVSDNRVLGHCKPKVAVNVIDI